MHLLSIFISTRLDTHPFDFNTNFTNLSFFLSAFGRDPWGRDSGPDAIAAERTWVAYGLWYTYEKMSADDNTQLNRDNCVLKRFLDQELKN